MSSVNKVILLGRLGSEPELRRIGDDRSVCRLSVATNRKWTDRHGERKEEVVWHRVSVWGKQGESCERYLSKGQAVYVEGRLRSYDFTDDDGKKRQATEIISHNVVFLPRNRAQGHGASLESPGEAGPAEADDALPF